MTDQSVLSLLLMLRQNKKEMKAMITDRVPSIFDEKD